MYRSAFSWLSLLVMLGMPSSVAFCQDGTPHRRPDCKRVYFPLPAVAGDVEAGRKHFTDAREAAIAGDAATAFEELWLAHQRNPADPLVRRALALPQRLVCEPAVTPGRGAPPILAWRPRTYLKCETPHFELFSLANRSTTLEIAEQLERFYWVWTQVFFPLWEGRTELRRALQGGGGIAAGKERLQVVLFRDAEQYVAQLQRHVPGIERSTGFYSDQQRCTFLFAGETADPATWQHELTHQLLREATRSAVPRDEMPGRTADFWLVEAIASYMESVRFAPTYALVGGWESPRLQFARYRWLAAGDTMRLAELVADGQATAQAREDLARWYAHGAAYAHLLMDTPVAGGKTAVLAKLVALYQIPLLPGETWNKAAELDVDTAAERMTDYLTLTDVRLYPPDPAIPLASICLNRTKVTAAGLQRLPIQSELRWLDLAYLPVDSQDVLRLVGDAGKLDQLNLERTAIDDAIAPLLVAADRLTELDLSVTRVGDGALATLSADAPLETVFLTATQVGDGTATELAKRPTLRQIDLQQTQVRDETIERLKREHTDIRFNPLQIRSQ